MLNLDLNQLSHHK